MSTLTSSVPRQLATAPAERQPKDRLFLLLRIALGAGLLLVLFGWIDLREVGTSLASIRLVPTLLLCVILTADRVLMAYKWNLLLRAFSLSIST